MNKRLRCAASTIYSIAAAKGPKAAAVDGLSGWPGFDVIVFASSILSVLRAATADQALQAGGESLESSINREYGPAPAGRWQSAGPSPILATGIVAGTSTRIKGCRPIGHFVLLMPPRLVVASAAPRRGPGMHDGGNPC